MNSCSFSFWIKAQNAAMISLFYWCCWCPRPMSPYIGLPAQVSMEKGSKNVSAASNCLQLVNSCVRQPKPRFKVKFEIQVKVRLWKCKTFLLLIKILFHAWADLPRKNNQCLSFLVLLWIGGWVFLIKMNPYFEPFPNILCAVSKMDNCKCANCDWSEVSVAK